jgi:hypothetical protein
MQAREGTEREIFTREEWGKGNTLSKLLHPSDFIRAL